MLFVSEFNYSKVFLNIFLGSGLQTICANKLNPFDPVMVLKEKSGIDYEDVNIGRCRDFHD